MNDNWNVIEGDCLDTLKTFPDNHFDSVVTDPPAGVSFMHREWDSDKGGRDPWINWLASLMKECYRVMKPGAHCLVWALPRTSHWTATAIENAGFEVRDVITHHYGSGFPKSQDVGKAIDKIGHDAKEWEGWGSALKPASEHWILARKPLGEKSIARNVLRYGTGALNIDACRVERAEDDVPGWHKSGADGSKGYHGEDTFRIREMTAEEIQERCGGKGRWPTNLVVSHSPGCERRGIKRVRSHGNLSGHEPSSNTNGVYSEFEKRKAFTAHGDGHGHETVEEWNCDPSCPVAELDRQSGTTKSSNHRRHNTATGHNATVSMGESTGDWDSVGHADSGGASRYFPNFIYQAKPAVKEREGGLEELPTGVLNRVNPGGLEHDPRWAPKARKNTHPTVKGVSLMEWLVTLITPPGGLILDPFCGSGSTGIAAVKKGFQFVGCELSSEYCDIARARITYWEGKNN